MSDTVLEIKDVAVAYDGRTVLDVPHLAVRRGEVLTLLGENGSGKTTLLRLFGLLLRPVRGRVFFHGEEVDFGDTGRLLQLRRRMAAVMQEPLLCRMSVQGNVGLGLRFRGLSGKEAKQRAREWLEKLSISHLAERPGAKLSGGEAQRTSLARAMVLNPEVLFLDEPFGALDAPTRQNLLQVFRAVLAESAVTTVFATHDRGEALGLGDRVAVLTQGRLAQVGSAEAVFSKPETVEVARFVGMETEIPGRIERVEGGRAEVECGGRILKADGNYRVGDEVYLTVRPEEIEVHPGKGSAPQDSVNALAGLVTSILPAESYYRIEIDCGEKVVAFVRRARFRENPVEPGDQVKAIFPSYSAHLIDRNAEAHAEATAEASNDSDSLEEN
jgi:tungstate transport system ATP-binding protein